MPVPTPDALNAADRACQFALQQLGKPYIWGATGPDAYDCSGLTQASWKAAGVSIPRTTYQQVRIGQAVTYANAAPGDLIFPFADISHVVMYLGAGQVVQAPQTGESVNVVKYYGSAGGIRRVSDQPGTGAFGSGGSLTTASSAPSSAQAGALNQLGNLIKTLESPADWASFGYVLGGAGVLGYAVFKMGALG